MEDRTRALRALIPAAHVVAALMLLLPMGDWAANVWPMRPGDFHWRYGATGLLAGFTLTPLLGVLVLALAAAFAGQRRLLRLLGWTALLAAVLTLAGAALFALDTVQVVAEVGADSRPVLALGATKAAVKLLLSAAWLAVLGPGAMAAARALPARARARRHSSEHVAAKVVAARTPAAAGTRIPARPSAAAAR